MNSDDYLTEDKWKITLSHLKCYNQWTCKSGEKISLGSMTAAYMINIYQMLRDKYSDSIYAQECASYIEIWLEIRRRYDEIEFICKKGEHVDPSVYVPFKN